MIKTLDLITVYNAKQTIGNHYDPSMPVFMCRDLQIVKDAGLSDLAWALCSPNSYCHKNDVIGFFELLDKYVEENSE